MAWTYPLIFDPQGAFLRVCMSPLSQKGRSGGPFILHSHRVLPCLSPCLDCRHAYYLNMFTEDKAWLFALFLLLLPFRRAKRRLIVNASTGAYLSLVSEKTDSCKYPA
ncbi:unnamed protein product [Rangifer tarandus platyrhynchus]|uniref:Uncharacterized protein n=1 Tax=Rangifer tarandus platyrhynchus TaxID=3082113 RepID=A0AC60A6Z8_RANTA